MIFLLIQTEYFCRNICGNDCLAAETCEQETSRDRGPYHARTFGPIACISK